MLKDTLIVISVWFLGSAPIVAFGQPSESPLLALEEVQVTARKREETLQNIPLAVTAFDQDFLERSGISDLSDLQLYQASLNIGPYPNNNASLTLYIRGIGTVDAEVITRDGGVGVYVDGVYLGRSQGLAMDMMDTRRVEILRGPQGTLYGRNTIGGAVNVISNAPSGEFGFKQYLTYGSWHQARTKTVVDLPALNHVSTKLVYLNSKHEGWVNNDGNGPNYNEEDKEGIQASFLWSPTDSLAVGYSYENSTVLATGPHFQNNLISARREKQSAMPADFPFDPKAKTKAHRVNIDWSVADQLEFKSISSYRELDSREYQDYQMSFGFPFQLQRDLEHEQWSQEFQLAGKYLDGQLDLMTGLYYFEEDAFELDAQMFGAPFRLTRSVEVNNRSSAIYSQVIYRPEALNDKLGVALGLRYTEDKRSAERLAGGTDVTKPPGKGAETYTNTDPTLTIDYSFDEAVMVYGRLASGYRSGGFNSSDDDISKGFDSESLLTAELGLKAELVNGRVRFNAAVFSTDYQDIQITINAGLPTDVSTINGGEATVDGAELEITTAVAQGLLFTVNAVWLDAGFDEPIIDPLTGADVTSANPYRFSPDYIYNVILDYTTNRTVVGTFNIRANHHREDDQYAYSLREGYSTTDLRVTLSDIPDTGSGELSLSLWSKNIFDKKYVLSRVFETADAYGEPVSYGIDVNYFY